MLRSVRKHGLHRWVAEALLSYDATRLVLDAIGDGGDDRLRVIEAARRPGAREGLLGQFSIARSGDAMGRRVECVDLSSLL